MATLLVSCTSDGASDDPVEVEGADDPVTDGAGGTSRAAPTDDLEGPAADAAAEVPDDWEVLTVHDDQTGPFAIGVPAELEVWTVGEPLTVLADAVDGTAWWEFWAPRLEPLEPEVSNVRAMIVDPSPDPVDEPVTLQVNVTPYDLDVEPDDAAAIAEIYRTVVEAQGSTVRDVGTVPWAGTTVAEVVHTVPDSIVPAARDVRQWFYPAADDGALWSIQCDAPQGVDVDERCVTALGSFRPPE